MVAGRGIIDGFPESYKSFGTSSSKPCQLLLYHIHRKQLRTMQTHLHGRLD